MAEAFEYYAGGPAMPRFQPSPVAGSDGESAVTDALGTVLYDRAFSLRGRPCHMRRGQQLLALWLQFDLELPRLPCTLFGAVGLNPDDALKSFVGMNRIPLATAAAMASNAEVM